MTRLVKGVRLFLRFGRLRNTLLPSLAVIAGALYAGTGDTYLIVLAVACTILLNVTITIWNDIEDAWSDEFNGITRIKDIQKDELYTVLLGCLVVALGVIIALAYFLPLSARIVLSGFVITGWFYNSSPIRASRRPILSIVLLGIAYGLLPFFLGLVLGRVTWQGIILALGWTIGRTSLSILKDYKDAIGDAKARKKTFLLVYGGTYTARLSFCMAFLGYSICIVLIAGHESHRLQAVITLAGVAGWLLYERAHLFRAKQYFELNRIFHACLGYQLVFDGLAIAWLKLS